MIQECSPALSPFYGSWKRNMVSECSNSKVYSNPFFCVMGFSSYNRDGILADVFEPHELEGTGTQAVDTLLLVLADDGVEQCCSGLEKEDGVGVTCLFFFDVLD